MCLGFDPYQCFLIAYFLQSGQIHNLESMSVEMLL